MAEPTSSLTYENLKAATAEAAGYGHRGTVAAGLSTAENTEIDLYVNRGQRRVLSAHDWYAFKPTGSSVVFSTKAAVPAKDIATVTLTAASATFHPTMIGRNVVFDTSGTAYAITGYTSSTVLTMASTAAGETAATGTAVGQPAAASTLTATTGVFNADMATETLTFVASSNGYTVFAYVSPTVVILSGDATGEASGDTFTVSGSTGTASGVPAAASALTATTGVFTAGLVGKYCEFDTSGTAYLINGFKDTDEISVVGDATAETSGDTFTIWDTFTITADGANRMPDDFGGLIGPVAFAANQGEYPLLKKTGPAQLRAMLQQSNSTGRPTFCAELALTGTAGQRFDLLTWRIPDQDYTVFYRYQVNPDLITAGLYPYGGSQMTQLFEAACLAAMELGKFQTKGPYEADYQQKLADAIRKDKRDHRSDTLGYLVDSEGRREYDQDYELAFAHRNLTTYNGTEYP